MENTFFIQILPNNFTKNETDLEQYKIDICRLCLDLTKLQSVKTIKLLAKNQESFKFIETEIKFQLPRDVCEKCWKKLDDFIKFVRKCKDSHLIYSKMQQKCTIKELDDSLVKVEENETEILTIENEVKVKQDSTEPKVTFEEVPQNCHIAEPENNLEEEKTKTEDNHISDKVQQNFVEVIIGPTKNIKTKKIDKRKLCMHCGEKVKNLSDHYKMNKNCKPKNYKCSSCSLRFFTRHRLDMHKKIKHDNMTFMCDICSKILTHPLSFQRHVLLHQNGRKYVCEICGKSYSRFHDLTCHKYTHSKIRPYKCKICGRSFTSPSAVYTHKKTHQKLEDGVLRRRGVAADDEKILCNDCNRYFATQRAFKSHLRSHNQNRQYRCKHCTDTFDDVHLYREHLTTHVVDKNYGCPICCKRFETRRSLYIHNISCHKERSQSCPMCEKKFKLKCHLNRHLALLHNVNKGRTFSCKFCDKVFNLKENLAAHERIHTGEKPYICHVCKNGFIDSSARKKHVRKVHGEDEVENINN